MFGVANAAPSFKSVWEEEVGAKSQTGIIGSTTELYPNPTGKSTYPCGWWFNPWSGIEGRIRMDFPYTSSTSTNFSTRVGSMLMPVGARMES